MHWETIMDTLKESPLDRATKLLLIDAFSVIGDAVILHDLSFLVASWRNADNAIATHTARSLQTLTTS